MNAQERTTIVGVFTDRERAEAALEALHRAGFGPDAVGLIVREAEAPAGVTVKADVRAEQGAATGAVTGGLLGGLLGAAAGVLIPGVGPVLAAGVLAGALGGGAIGVATGGLIGALIAQGIPEEEARHYETEFQAGRTLVTVRTGSRRELAARILTEHGAHDVDSMAATASGLMR